MTIRHWLAFAGITIGCSTAVAGCSSSPGGAAGGGGDTSGSSGASGSGSPAPGAVVVAGSSGGASATSGSGSSGGANAGSAVGTAGGSGPASTASGMTGGGSSGVAEAGVPMAGSDASAGVGVGPASDPDIASSVTLTMDPFTVNPGQEVYMCQDFANPFHGQQADIKTYELTMAQGSHHMFAFYKSNATNTAVTTCPQGGLQFAPFTFTAQSQNVVETYPQGVGATIPSTTGFTINVHYLNPGTTPITGHVSLTMYVAKPGVVTQHAGVLFLNQALLSVPATGQPSTSTSTYTLPQDMYLMTSGSHMHKRATGFSATTSTGQTLFKTTQWAEPAPAEFSQPVHLTAGTKVSWSCTYVNDTGQALTFGESANTNVMCISVSVFYPVQDINNPVVSTQF